MSVSPGSQPAYSGGSVHSSNGSMHDVDVDGRPQDIALPQKRKGGRKPIYATSEERKQRNRQAQAAFRERRTEYIKQLEVTIKQNEETMANLRSSHRLAADECHLLKYRNSLLERILVENGYDVQAELQSRGSSPLPRPQHASPVSPGAPISQQAIMNRHQQARRATPASSGKLESEYNTPSIQSLRISPGASTHIHSPSSSSFSSPAMAFNSMSVADGRSGNHMSQPVQHSHHATQSVPAHYNYSAFASVAPGQSLNNGSSHHTEVSDPSKYGSAGFTGYHTPSSMDEAQRSRNSSMAHTGMTSLDSEREPQYQTTAGHMVDRPSNDLNYYGTQMQPQSVHSQTGLQSPMSYPSQRPMDFMPVQSSASYPTNMYGGNYQGMVHSNCYLQEDLFSLSASMQYPNQFAIDAGPLR